jgi:hypothetical protein
VGDHASARAELPKRPVREAHRRLAAGKPNQETRAKNLPKGELKRRGITYAQLAEKLAEIGVSENERNLNNKISRGGFTAAFLLECLEAIGSSSLRLSD